MQDDFDDGGIGLPDDEMTGGSDLPDLDGGAETEIDLDAEGGGMPSGRPSGGARGYLPADAGARTRTPRAPRKRAARRKRPAERRRPNRPARAPRKRAARRKRAAPRKSGRPARRSRPRGFLIEMRLVSAAAALSILLGGTVAAAQEPLEALDPAEVVASALTIEAFVPAGWVIEQRAEGTLTAAPQPDIVLQLVEQTTGFFRVRALVIVTRIAGGGFTRAAVAPTLLPPQRGEPNPSQPLDRPSLAIARNVLTISYHDTLARFRYEPVSKQFLLIGEDHTFKYDTSGVSSPQMRGMRGGGMVSTNYLTGSQIVEQREFDAKAQRDLATSSHTNPVEKTRETIEEIDWSLDLFARRLFAAALIADLPLRPDDRIPVETDRGGIARVPRVLLAQFLQDLPADEFQPDTLQWPQS